MLTLLSDENFNGDVVQGLRRGVAGVDLVRVRDVELMGAEDPALLEWAALNGRVILTHDRNTFPGFALDRVKAGQPMPGVIVVSDLMPVGRALEELELVLLCFEAADCDQQVIYLPL
jgi:predicted nuclease of predicted toxin-antitoxin system